MVPETQAAEYQQCIMNMIYDFICQQTQAAFKLIPTHCDAAEARWMAHAHGTPAHTIQGPRLFGSCFYPMKGAQCNLMAAMNAVIYFFFCIRLVLTHAPIFKLADSPFLLAQDLDGKIVHPIDKFTCLLAKLCSQHGATTC